MAKVVTTRFAAALASAIGPEQSGFLPGRRIEDNILLTSLVPSALIALDVAGATIYLDISKAFDIIDREFLYACLETLGASPGMVNLARILLHNTKATTHVNGVDSPPNTWNAGVRQGCPLSPLLYVVVAQSLTSWLRAQPRLGLTTSGVRVVSNHYADDTVVFVTDLSDEALAAAPLPYMLGILPSAIILALVSYPISLILWDGIFSRIEAAKKRKALLALRDALPKKLLETAEPDGP
jgi:hypothetical protein